MINNSYYFRFPARHLRFLISALIWLLLCGCAPPAGGQSPPVSPPSVNRQAIVSRVIVKFADDVADYAQLLGRLSEALGVRLRYSRPLAGGAHLLLVEGLKDSAHSTWLIAELNRRTEVEYAEADAIMRHQ